jgi:uncharacterized Ntn-hydrolase superfamily protein
MQLAHTYSIVAFDPEAQQLGVAVQSHYFGVGGTVPWLEPGVGAVATQSFVDVSYGPLGLALMRGGKSATQALHALLAADPLAERRQVAMVDIHGDVAAHTGRECIAAAGHRIGAGYSVQANLMLRDTVWNAMADAYEQCDGDLAERMLSALEAAEAEGGDIRGSQSAALAVIKATHAPAPWRARVFDLRVDDHAAPLAELRRLLTVCRTYYAWDAAEELLRGEMLDETRVREAMLRFSQAPNLMPGNAEGTFWFACALVNGGYLDAALPYFRRIFAAQPLWRELVPRLAPVGLLPDDVDVLRRIVTVS